MAVADVPTAVSFVEVDFVARELLTAVSALLLLVFDRHSNCNDYGFGSYGIAILAHWSCSGLRQWEIAQWERVSAPSIGVT